MRVIVNGEPRDLAGEVSLLELLDRLGLPTERIAIEHNRAVVRKQELGETVVKDADRIEIVHFVGGG